MSHICLCSNMCVYIRHIRNCITHNIYPAICIIICDASQGEKSGVKLMTNSDMGLARG